MQRHANVLDMTRTAYTRQDTRYREGDKYERERTRKQKRTTQLKQ